MSEGITFSAIFNKATTTVDGGWLVSFQVSQDKAAQIIQIASMRQSVLQVAVIPIGEALSPLGDLPPISDLGDI